MTIFYTTVQGRAERAGPRLAADLGKRGTMDALTDARRSSAGNQAGLSGERCAPGRRLTAYLYACGRNGAKPLTGPDLERFLPWNATPADLRAWAQPPPRG